MRVATVCSCERTLNLTTEARSGHFRRHSAKGKSKKNHTQNLPAGGGDTGGVILGAGAGDLNKNYACHALSGEAYKCKWKALIPRPRRTIAPYTYAWEVRSKGNSGWRGPLWRGKRFASFTSVRREVRHLLKSVHTQGRRFASFYVCFSQFRLLVRIWARGVVLIRVIAVCFMLLVLFSPPR